MSIAILVKEGGLQGLTFPYSNSMKLTDALSCVFALCQTRLVVSEIWSGFRCYCQRGLGAEQGVRAARCRLSLSMNHFLGRARLKRLVVPDEPARTINRPSEDTSVRICWSPFIFATKTWACRSHQEELSFRWVFKPAFSRKSRFGCSQSATDASRPRPACHVR